MIESAALDIIAVRAIESADRERTVWTDTDRAWASRAAAEVVGETAPPEHFVARRAQFALERLREAHRNLPRAVAALRWRPWVGYAIIVAAFAIGIAVDRLGDAQRINVLAPPVLLLLFWNIAVYVALAASYVVRYGEPRAPGPLRGIVVRLSAGAASPGAPGGDPLAAAVARLRADWTRLAAPLYAARAARILHLAAATFALGVIAGLYLRGIAFEYRATWESTFLDPGTVRALLAIVLAPGAWFAAMPVPDLAQVTAIRAPGSENAAPWLHLMAMTLLVLVILPRLVLALFAGLLERHRATRLPVAMDEPYFQRLLRGFHGGPSRARALPYSYTPGPAAIAGLETILGRLLGGSAAVTVAPATAYGGEDELPADFVPAGAGPVVVLFSLAATPEHEAHGAFVAAVTARAAGAQAVLVIVDESPLRATAGAAAGVDPARLDTRRGLWRELLAGTPIAPVFVDLAAPDLPAAEAALDGALARAES